LLKKDAFKLNKNVTNCWTNKKIQRSNRKTLKGKDKNVRKNIKDITPLVHWLVLLAADLQQLCCYLAFKVQYPFWEYS